MTEYPVWGFSFTSGKIPRWYKLVATYAVISFRKVLRELNFAQVGIQYTQRELYLRKSEFSTHNASWILRKSYLSTQRELNFAQVVIQYTQRELNCTQVGIQCT